MPTYTDGEELQIALEEYEVSSKGEQVTIGKNDEIVLARSPKSTTILLALASRSMR